MKVGRVLFAILFIAIIGFFSVEAALNLYWKLSLNPRLQKTGAVTVEQGARELQLVQNVELTAHQFLPAVDGVPANAKAGVSASPRLAPIPDLVMSPFQKKNIELARRVPVWFKRGDLIRKANLDTAWMGQLSHVALWRTPYGAKSSVGGPFRGATWAIIRLAQISRMQMTEAESFQALQEVRHLERLLLTSESHLLNLQGLQTIGVEVDFVNRHRRLFSYLNRWTLPPADFSDHYREVSQ